jgi:EmrB/QacA subfamily drug resistance transporter
VLVTACLALFLVNVDNTVVNVALPSIGTELGASTTDLQWVVNGFALAFAGLLFAAGALGDRFGHRRVLVAGLALLGGAAAVGAMSTTVGALVAARAVMGVGAALVFPATLAILTVSHPDPRERARAIGVWSAVAGLAVAAGPLLGGALLQHFWWGSVLLVNVPLAAVAVLAAVALVPETREERPRPLDVPGIVLSVAGMTALVVAIIEGPRWGWVSPGTLTAAAAAAALLALFVVRQRRAVHPMLDPRLAAHPGLRVGVLAISTAFFALLGLVFLATQYLQVVRGYDTLAAGACIVPAAVGIGIGSGAAPGIAARMGARPVMAAGLAVAAAGMATATALDTDSPLWVFLVAVALLGIGVGSTTAPATDLIVGAVPRTMAGVGSAINDTTRELGGTLGVAVLGSVAVSVYRRRLEAGADGLSAPAVAAARESPAAAAAPGLDPQQAERLLTVTQAAFVDGLDIVAVVGAIVLAAAALLVALTTRRGSPVDARAVARSDVSADTREST